MLTPEQIAKLRGDFGIGVEPKTTVGSLFGIQDSLAKRGANVTAAKDREALGQQSRASTILQTAGQAAGLATDVAGGAIAAVTPQPIKDVVSGTAQVVGQGFGAIDQIAKTIDPKSQNIMESYSAWKQAHPEAAGNLEASVNIGSLLPVGKIVGKAGEVVSDMASIVPKLASGAIESPRIATAVKNAAKGVLFKETPAPVATALKETQTNSFKNYVQLAKDATQSNKAPTPLEFAGSRATEALKTIDQQLKAINIQKSALLDKPKWANHQVGDVASSFATGLEKRLSSTKLVAGDEALVTKVQEEVAKLGSNPTAKQVDKFIDYAQKLIYSSNRDLTLPVTGEGEGILRPLIGQMNSALKKRLPTSYTNLNASASQLYDVIGELNTKLGKDSERAGALMKRVFSPSDANTKALFEKVNKLTGIDLVNEATVAKYAMELFGDVRQKSLLSDLGILAKGNNPSGMIEKMLAWAHDHLNTPEMQAERATALTKSAKSLPLPAKQK